MVHKRMMEGRRYLEAIKSDAVAVMLLFLLSSIQIVYYYFSMPKDAQICFFNRRSRRWVCENDESSRGLANQYDLGPPATKESLCGWYAAFVFLLDVLLLMFAISLPNWVVRSETEEKLSARAHRKLLVLVGRSALRFATVTHVLMLVVYQCIFDGVMHRYKSFQGFAMIHLMLLFCITIMVLAAKLIRGVIRLLQQSKLEMAQQEEQMHRIAEFQDMGLSAVELQVLARSTAAADGTTDAASESSTTGAGAAAGARDGAPALSQGRHRQQEEAGEEEDEVEERKDASR